MSLGEFEGEHYGLPDQRQLKSMIWYPKDDFDAAGYQVPDHVGRAARAVRSDRRRRQDPMVRRVRERDRHRLAGDGLDGRHHAHDGRAGRRTSSGPPTRSRSTTRRSSNAGEMFGTSCSPTATCWAAPRTRRPSPSATHRSRCSRTRRVLAAPPGDVHQRVLPGGHRGGGRLRLVPAPRRSTRRARCSPASWRWCSGTVPRSWTSSSASARCRCSARWAADIALGRLSPNVDVGEECYANPILADASTILADVLATGTGRLRRGRPDARRRSDRAVLDRHGRVHAAGARLAARASSTTSRRAGPRSSDEPTVAFT